MTPRMEILARTALGESFNLIKGGRNEGGDSHQIDSSDRSVLRHCACPPVPGSESNSSPWHGNRPSILSRVSWIEDRQGRRLTRRSSIEVEVELCGSRSEDRRGENEETGGEDEREGGPGCHVGWLQGVTFSIEVSLDVVVKGRSVRNEGGCMIGFSRCFPLVEQ